MRLLLILASLVCVVQCTDILVKLIQEVHIGNCGPGCNRCPSEETNTTSNAAEEEAKLTQLQEEKAALEEQKDNAQATSDSVTDAGDATTNLTTAASGGRKRRRRATSTVNVTSCEDSSETISGTSEEIILTVIQGILTELQSIATSVADEDYDIDTTKLVCYVSLAGDLTSQLNSGEMEKPDDMTQITSVSVSVTTSVESTTQTLVVVIVTIETNIEAKENEITAQKAVVVAAGGTVVDLVSGATGDRDEDGTGGSEGTISPGDEDQTPSSAGEDSGKGDPLDGSSGTGGAGPPDGNIDEELNPGGSLIGSICELIRCNGPPEGNCTGRNITGQCCLFWFCDDAPQTCTSKNGTEYEIYQSWEEGCQICNCYYDSWTYEARSNCYTMGCPRPPHPDCMIFKKEDSCCDEIFCDNTTCQSEGTYYGIGVSWTLPSDPCENCTCKEDGAGTAITCERVLCEPPPEPHCRGIKYKNQCCASEWDCTNEYLLTAPKKVIRGQTFPICVYPKGSSGSKDVTLTLTLSDGRTSSTMDITTTIDSGSSECFNFTAPESMSGSASLFINGSIGEADLSEDLPVSTVSLVQTFVQTDKFLYMPGQVVQFRILTLVGVKTLVSYANINLVFITSPRGNRIAQWDDVANPAGLVQLQFLLADQVEEGAYRIEVRTEGNIASQTFRVEEYVLPRFSVTLEAPSYILVTANEVVIRACAKYTYGQDVSGEVTLSVRRKYYYGSYSQPDLATETQTINGCADVTISTESFGYVYGQLEAYAVFTEEGTGITAEASAIFNVQSNAISLLVISQEKYYKSHLPYLYQVKATTADSTPAVGETLSLCLGKTCSNYTTDASGTITAILPPGVFSEESSLDYAGIIIVRELIEEESGPMGTLRPSVSYTYLKRFYSPSNSSLSLFLRYEVFECDPETNVLSIPVFFVVNGTTSAVIHIQAMSRGQLVYMNDETVVFGAGDLELDDGLLLEPLLPIEDNDLIRGKFNIDIPITQLSSRKLYVLVWYSRDDGEVVSASTVLDVSQCLRNPTSLEWETNSNGLPAPKDAANLTVSSAPSSICGLGVVDLSSQLLSSGQKGKLTLDAVFKFLSAAEFSIWENSQINDGKYCGGVEDSNDLIFLDGGAEPLPLNKKRSSIWYPNSYGRTYDYDAIKSFEDVGLNAATDLTLQTRTCHYNNYYYGGGGGGFGGQYDYILEDNEEALRPEAAPPGQPDAALPAPESGNVEKTEEESSEDLARTHFPETWLWDLIAMDNNGEAVLTLQLPDTITEWVAEAVCVHPGQGLGLSGSSSITTFSPFFLDIHLPPTAKRGELVHILVSVFNYLDQSLPVIVELEDSPEYSTLTSTFEVCVETGGKEVVEFPVTLSEVGKVALTFNAIVNTSNTDCGGTIDTEGRLRDEVSRNITVKYPGVMKEETRSLYICADDEDVTWPVFSPVGIIEDSDIVYLTASADPLGPTLENLGHLIRKPYGCGEQNMLNFAPNIFILQYLTASSQLTPEIEARLLDYLLSGYQRELTYQRSDGSYSAFGDSDSSGSTWLTAFVLKSFSQADAYITVDPGSLSRTTTWLLSLQMIGGCFESVGNVIHKDMKGGVSDATGSLVPLTAYVVIALLEAGYSNTDQAVIDAVTCITSSPSSDIYTNALIAYALALAGDTAAAPIITSVYGSLTSTSMTLPKERVVEIAGYLLLAMLEANSATYAGEAAEIVSLITGYMNGQGGFGSTQDTVVALQALARYYELFPPSDVSLILTILVGTASHDFIFNSDNKLLQLTHYITEDLPYNVTVSSSGQGCAIVVLVHRYNVPKEPTNPAFNMTVETTREPCASRVTMEICVTYLMKDLESNMAVIEIEPQTGYIFEDHVFLIIDKNVIKRYELEDDKVLLYFDSITANGTCISLDFEEEFTVENPLPGTVLAYDYYVDEQSISEDFIFPAFDCPTK